MKSIEERAVEYAKGQWDELTARAAYIAGAKDQKTTIEEEVRLDRSNTMIKAEYDREVAFIDWYFKNRKGTPTYSDAIEWARKQTIEEVCNWLKSNVKWMSNQLMSILIYELRKALEE